MIILYTSVNSSSCRKARCWFKQHHISVNEHNVSSEGITRQQLTEIMERTENGTDDVVCTRSNAYKNLGIEINSLNFDDFLNLICRIPELLKTPIIVSRHSVQIGFNRDSIRSFISHDERKTERLRAEQEADLVSAVLN
ncbi:Spx/MgsR family RNA polymerase-binding regulatory protein [uncultured Limosilactobacillus sp.]|uniref:Spx/MgsR family RNA polymerase-binding regulatory protein n=1 Tax=uncultured Limosilactobacillus sp. TaxID=2837629 RepID=UPI0025E7C01C|nr:Spx/MgsR family RNA polymerase-binding regulatory protein [uncultured Limosilactobacillus sp.]